MPFVIMNGSSTFHQNIRKPDFLMFKMYIVKRIESKNAVDKRCLRTFQVFVACSQMIANNGVFLSYWAGFEKVYFNLLSSE